MEAGNARGGMRRIRKFAGVSLQFNWDGERRATVPKASARWIGQGVEGYRATRPACNTRTLPSPARGSDVASRNRGRAKTSFARRPPRLLSSPTDSALWRMARSAQRTSTKGCLPTTTLLAKTASQSEPPVPVGYYVSSSGRSFQAHGG
jgi:hypothetical protein